MRSRGHPATRLLPGITGGDEDDPIEMQLMECALGGVEMGDVDRVECPSEDSGSHDVENRAAEVSPAEAPV